MQASWRCALVLGLCACGDDDAQAPEDPPRDAEVVDARTGDTPHDAEVADARTGDARAADARGEDPAANDAGAQDAGIEESHTDAGFEDAGALDAALDGSADAGAVVREPPCNPDDYPSSYPLPPGGGTFSVCLASGAVLSLQFPRNDGGLELSANIVDPATRSWPNPSFASAFRDVVDLRPDVTFQEPVQVTLPPGELMAFVFNDDLDVPTPLFDEGTGYTVTPSLFRLGTLAVVSSLTSCESTPGAPFTSGWVDDVDYTPAYCSGAPGRPVWRHFVCPSAPFCYNFAAYCCVRTGAPAGGCTADGVPGFSYVRADSERPYCQGTSHLDVRSRSARSAVQRRR